MSQELNILVMDDHNEYNADHFSLKIWVFSLYPLMV